MYYIIYVDVTKSNTKAIIHEDELTDDHNVFDFANTHDGAIAKIRDWDDDVFEINGE